MANTTVKFVENAPTWVKGMYKEIEQRQAIEAEQAKSLNDMKKKTKSMLATLDEYIVKDTTVDSAADATPEQNPTTEDNK